VPDTLPRRPLLVLACLPLLAVPFALGCVLAVAVALALPLAFLALSPLALLRRLAR
jgi:hypothetical protein